MLTLIWMVLIAGGPIYFIVMYINQKEIEGEQRERLLQLHTSMTLAEQKMSECYLPILQAVIDSYGENIASQISKRQISQDMPEELVVLSWGEPSEKKQDFYRNSLVEKWYYHPYYNRLSNKKHKREVTIENNRVAGWKDLN